jgi:hypothetical protein
MMQICSSQKNAVLTHAIVEASKGPYKLVFRLATNFVTGARCMAYDIFLCHMRTICHALMELLGYLTAKCEAEH